MQRYFAAFLVLFTLPAAAYANGAMALALSLFAWPLWLIYVAAMVLFEALWIGRALGMPLGDALKRSFAANFVTLVLGGIFSGFFGYLLYGAFGSFLNPNPLSEAILLLSLGALFSAIIEARFWESWHDKVPWRSTFAAHLLGIPVALVILLLPSHPYPGLEAQANFRRSRAVHSVKRALSHEVQEKERFPLVKTFPELLEHVSHRPELKYYQSASDLWAAAYMPDFQRFDTGEQRRNPLEWNASLSGKQCKDLTKRVWVVRWHYSLGNNSAVEGWVYNPDHGYGELVQSRDPKDLEF